MIYLPILYTDSRVRERDCLCARACVYVCMCRAVLHGSYEY